MSYGLAGESRTIDRGIRVFRHHLSRHGCRCQVPSKAGSGLERLTDESPTQGKSNSGDVKGRSKGPLPENLACLEKIPIIHLILWDEDASIALLPSDLDLL